MRSLQQFWSMRRIGEDRVTLARLGVLRLWLARAEKQWGYAIQYGESTDLLDIAQVPEDVVPPELEWSDLIFNDAPREYAFHPSGPDRPVVVKPRQPVTILPGQNGIFHVKVPVFVQVALCPGRKEIPIAMIPSQPLIDTWFGSPTEGDLCYTLPSLAVLDIEELQPKPNEIVCSLEIVNNSDEAFSFEKFCLRSRLLKLFSGNSHLWGGIIKIQCENLFGSVSVRYGDKEPEIESDLIDVTPKGRREDKGISRLSFGSSHRNDLVLGK